MKSLNSSHWKYVDDVTISEVIKETEESRLQTELNELQQWACENGLNARKWLSAFYDKVIIILHYRLMINNWNWLHLSRFWV
jgi:hypothetical protein